jgi:sulfite reductase (ferredoxin)
VSFSSSSAPELITTNQPNLTTTAANINRYHGSYQQDNREKRQKGKQKAYSFMLRLKMPCGEVPPLLHATLDDLSDKYGEGHLRATTRQAYQLHGVMKGDLKEVRK